jgi:hypothetical protein
VVPSLLTFYKSTPMYVKLLDIVGILPQFWVTV